jgi:methylated-DNA-[protein]-cysteine S-methyltransferase
MSPSAPRLPSDRHATLADRTIETPLGPVRLVASDRALVAVLFEGQRLRRAENVDGNVMNDTLDRAGELLRRYFAGDVGAVCELPCDAPGTPLERAVWRALREIPPGATRSYGEIATAVGRPGAARAIGRANGNNPLAIFVPCHRVIGADGSLTGYAGGIERKRWLLDHERRARVIPAATSGSMPKMAASLP